MINFLNYFFNFRWSRDSDKNTCPNGISLAQTYILSFTWSIYILFIIFMCQNKLFSLSLSLSLSLKELDWFFFILTIVLYKQLAISKIVFWMFPFEGIIFDIFIPHYKIKLMWNNNGKLCSHEPFPLDTKPIFFCFVDHPDMCQLMSQKDCQKHWVYYMHTV